jgi:hypothetical protein
MKAVYDIAILFCLFFFGCASTKDFKKDTQREIAELKTTSNFSHEDTITGTDMAYLGSNDLLPQTRTLPVNVSSDSLNQSAEINGGAHRSLENSNNHGLETTIDSEPESAVANKIVENYLSSKNKEPGGHCLMVSKKRFEKAYKDVYGHSLYEDLPDSMATTYYTPKEVFDYLYVSASGVHEGWRNLPIEYRGKGNAGAIAYAGMGTLINGDDIWSGKLNPGALMQVWKRRNDYEKVVKGIEEEKDFDPFGHSFIFMGYVRNDNQEIIGIRIADQGYQSYRVLVPKDYEVWWAVNLSI